jgi:hypothetical protein
MQYRSDDFDGILLLPQDNPVPWKVISLATLRPVFSITGGAGDYLLIDFRNLRYSPFVGAIGACDRSSHHVTTPQSGFG